jgi:PAS domain S-box-containing protein
MKELNNITSGSSEIIEGEEYTSKEILEIRGSLIFIAVTSITSLIGLTFQILAGHGPAVILPTLFLYLTAVLMSWRLYLRKKHKRNAGWYPFAIGLIVLLIPVTARYNYTIKVDWLYAAQSHHVNWLLIANLISFQFLYDKRLYRAMIFFVISNVVIFYILAWHNGVPMPFHTYTDGAVNYGVMSSREIYSILMMITVSYLSYMNIYEIEKFDKLTSQQAEIINRQSDEQAIITQEVRAQYEELEAQYEEIENLNEDMSATQEEILQVNKNLEQEKKKLFTTLKSIPQGVITVDNLLNVESVNNGACSIFGLSEKSFSGKNINSVLKVCDRNGNSMDFSNKEFLSGNVYFDFYNSGIISHKNGVKDVILKSSPVVIEDGITAGYVIVAEDITELKKMKDQMLNSCRMESIGIFAGGIAHDINNFFTGMLGCVALAKSDPSLAGNDKILKYLEDMESTTFMARGLAEQLLTFAKGGAPLKKLFSIRELIDSSAEFVLSGTAVKLTSDIDENLYNIEADESQISQVINNILINAAQAMPDGGSIIIKGRNVYFEDNNRYDLSAGRYVIIQIEDTGPGIDSSVAVRIFDPFFTTKSKGSGLGLSVAYSVITRHGGMITVSSGADNGALFTLILPAVEKKIAEKIEEKAPGFRLRGTVLLMDDDEMIRRVGESLLSNLGLNVVSAEDGESAVKIFKEYCERGECFDLVILDLTVKGGMGGLEAFSAMMRIAPEVKGIVSSGYSSDPVMSNYREYGFAGVLKKPYMFNELSSLLKELLG